MAMVIASGVASDGNREILGCDLGDSESESEAFWQQFLTSLRDRGLNGVRLVISDAHRGLAAAVDPTPKPSPPAGTRSPTNSPSASPRWVH